MHYQNIFILEIFAFCVVGVKFYKTGDEWLYRLTGLFTMLMIPVAALKYVMGSGNTEAVKIFSLPYSILCIIVSVGLGVCTNLIAATLIKSTQLFSQIKTLFNIIISKKILRF